MRMNAISKILLLGVLGSIIFSACQREECQEIIPEMSYNRFEPSIGDTGQLAYNLVFDFTDCDGDFGKEAKVSIVDENGTRQTNNFFIDFYYLENNEWLKYEFDSGAPGFNTNIPVLNENGAQSILTGEIEKTISLVVFPYDTIKFESRILDNAGHYSPMVETPTFIMN